MKGTALIISKMKGIRKICSQMFPFIERIDKMKVSVTEFHYPETGKSYNISSKKYTLASY